MNKFNVGDIVKGNEKSNDNYGITNTCMAEGCVTKVDGSKIKIRVLSHDDPDYVGNRYDGLDEDCFDFIRHEEAIAGERLQAILDLHKKWLAGEEGGTRANLTDADLTDADLTRADLTDADLTRANLTRADLTDADLTRADLTDADLTDADLTRANLTRADLSQAKNLLSAIGFLDANFERTDKGYIAYKTFGVCRHSPGSWKIEPNSVITENVNPCRTTLCGSGINVAPLDWVRRNYGGEIWKVLIEWPWLAGVVVPYNTDGKIRCEKVRLLEVVK